MISFYLFKTEFKRSLKSCCAALFLSLMLGLILSTAFNFKDYLNSLFKPINWAADLIILPKGLTVQQAHQDILQGQPSGLLPQALYQTLKSQIQQESNSLQSPTIQIAAIVPYKMNDQKPDVALFDYEQSKSFFISNSNIFDTYQLKDWQEVQSQVGDKSFYRTDEWKDKTIFLILAKGPAQPIENLRQLINRRTVAEAFYVNQEKADDQNRLSNLKFGLNTLISFILLLTLTGLALSFEILRMQHKKIQLVLTELKMKKIIFIRFLVLQFLFLVVTPAALGFFAGAYYWPYLKLII